MKFSSLYELVLENEDNTTYVLILEDTPGRVALMRAFMNKFLPNQRYVVFDKMGPAEEFIEKHYKDIVAYTLDYHLYDKTTGYIGALLKYQGNDGSNVIIHSDDDVGREELRKYLPKAVCIQAPDNIMEITKRLS